MRAYIIAVIILNLLSGGVNAWDLGTKRFPYEHKREAPPAVVGLLMAFIFVAWGFIVLCK